MSEKRFKTLEIVIEDEIGSTQTCIRSELSAPQFMEKIFQLKEENEQLKATNEKLRWDLNKTREDLNYFANLKVTAMRGSDVDE